MDTENYYATRFPKSIELFVHVNIWVLEKMPRNSLYTVWDAVW
jgi:hypothetical protein